jgi:hypothetical protein
MPPKLLDGSWLSLTVDYVRAHERD